MSKARMRVNLFSFLFLPLTDIYNPDGTAFGGDTSIKVETEVAAMVPRDELDGTTTMAHGGLNLPRVPGPADENDVMREQLEYLIGHATEQSICGCSECQRYLRVRSVLLEIFSEPAPQQVRQLAATFSKAA